MIKTIKSKVSRLRKFLTGQVGHLKETVSVNKKWYGNDYGGFYVCPDLLNQHSIVYSFGVGEDISFDNAIIANHNCYVFAFDPTPKSIGWVKCQNKSSKFVFFEYGIADKSGLHDFCLPKNTKHVSGSFVKQKNVDDRLKVQVEMKSFTDIINELGHSKIDILKMDIEGAEYYVLDNILDSKIAIDQILIEFHDRLFDDGNSNTIRAVNNLNHHGFEIFGVSASFEEVSFIKKKACDVVQ